MLYCDDAKCPNFQTDDTQDCALGFAIELRLPKSWQDANNHNWGWKMPKSCRIKFSKPPLKSEVL